MQTRLRAPLVLAALASLALAACGDDDGAGVRDLGGSSSTSDSASSAGSGSSSASGIAASDLAQDTDNELVEAAVVGYRAYLTEQISQLLVDTTVFTDAVRAGDVDAAKAAYPQSRRSWERIEPIAGLIEDVDGAVDAREDDYDGPDDPAFTGWHKLEWYLWEVGDVAEAGEYADRLDADLQALAGAVDELELPPGVLTVGAQELIEEVAAPDGKLSGEEDRYSGTDLYDFQANVEGSEALVELLTPALEEADPALLADIEARFAELDAQLAALGSFEDGFPHYDEVTDTQRTEFAATLAELAELLSLLNGTLGLS